MAICTILVVNNAPGCGNPIAQQFTGDCDTYIVRLSSNSNALGPFDVYLDGNLIESGLTRTEMFNGVVVTCGCPTPTPVPSFTPTPSSTATPTPTPSITPSSTPTGTPTGTPTQTPSPTPTLDNFQILLLTQDGFEILAQDGTPLLAQQEVTIFLVSSGDTFCDQNPVLLTQTIYASSNEWSTVLRFYSDSQLITPFNGGGLYYTNESGGCGPCVVIDNNGFSTFQGNPC
jgi:hypothetical protein